MAVALNDPRRADARGWGEMWSPGAPPRTDMVPLIIDGIPFVGGVHPKIHELAEVLLLECVERGYRIRDVPRQTWGFAWRAIRGTVATPTNHSSGIAFDVNSAVNWLGREDGGDIPAWMPNLFNEYGWRWGGDYTGRKDPMHFEFMGTPNDAAALTIKAKEELMALSPEEKATLKRAEAFLDAVTGPLKPGKDSATATGAGERVARATLAVERDAKDPDGVAH
jgi:hypothetical protein